jgi:hypothetical protein
VDSEVLPESMEKSFWVSWKLRLDAVPGKTEERVGKKDMYDHERVS